MAMTLLISPKLESCLVSCSNCCQRYMCNNQRGWEKWGPKKEIKINIMFQEPQEKALKIKGICSD